MSIRNRYASIEILGTCLAWNESSDEWWAREVLDAENRCSARPVVGDRLGLRCGCEFVLVGGLEVVKSSVVGDGCIGPVSAPDPVGVGVGTFGTKLVFRLIDDVVLVLVWAELVCELDPDPVVAAVLSLSSPPSLAPASAPDLDLDPPPSSSIARLSCISGRS